MRNLWPWRQPWRRGPGSLRPSPREVRKVGVHVANVVATGLIGVVVIPVLTRLLTPDDYGTYAIATAVAGWAGVLLYGWLTPGLGRFLPAADFRRATVIRAVSWTWSHWLMAMSLLGGLAILTIDLAIGLGILLASASILVNIKIAESRALRDLTSYTTWNITQAVTTLAFPLLVVAVISRSASALLVSGILGSFAAGVIARGSPKKLSSSAGAPTESTSVISAQLLSFGIPLIGSSLGLSVLASFDRFAVGLIRGDDAAGIYAANFGLLFRPLSAFSGAIQHYLVPEISEAWDRSQSPRWRKLLWGAAFAAVVPAAALGSTVALFPNLVPAILGEDFRLVPRSFHLGAVAAGLTYSLYAVARNLLLLQARTIAITFNIALVGALTGIATWFTVKSSVGLSAIPWLSAGGYLLASLTLVYLYLRRH